MSINARACVDGLLGGHALAGGALFIGRRFLSALPMLILITMADNATARSSTSARVGAFCAAVVLGAVVYALAFHYTQPAGWIATDGTFSDGTIFLVMQFFQVLPYGGLAAALLFYFAHEQRHTRALQDSSLAKLALDRQTIEARLQALQAQIEPHFLFNTLANVRLLYEGDASRAKALIHDLADYLRAALPCMRETGSTLGRELALVQAYLRILKVRMEERLDVSVEVPADLCSASLPSMMLTTLVENAIKHGLNPRPEGGTIAIRAEQYGTALRIVVTDDGVGFQQKRGAGIGLANTRARLASLYGEAGLLTLEANPRGGVLATIELPYCAPGAQATAS